MKQLAILLCFFLIWQTAFSQTNNFAPVGAKWWYSANDFPPTVTPLTIESIGDTIIDGKLCRMLSLNPTPNNVNGDRKIYIFNEGQRVYQYFPTEEAFYLLYDFSLSIGEGYWCHALDFSLDLDSCYVKIIDIEIVSINGVDLQKQYINRDEIPGCYYDWADENIELFGNTKSIIPTYGLLEYSQGPLRCYEDPDFGFYSTGETATCDEILSDVSNLPTSATRVYPNPFTDHIVIDIPTTWKAISIQLKSINGAVLIDNGSSLELGNLNYLPSGIYVLQLQFDDMLQYLLIDKY